jgi:hypothetical protein
MSFREWVTMFSGEDITIVRRTDKSFQKRFAFVGAFVLLIFLLCFGSCTYAIYCFFGQNVLLATTIGVFFGWMVTNIYLLLLYTLTPNLLTEDDGRTAKLSLALRCGFIVLLALIVSRPVSVFLFDRWLVSDVEQRKSELLGSHALTADELLVNQEYDALQRYAQGMHLAGYEVNPDDSIVQKILLDSVYMKKASDIAKQLEKLAGQSKTKEERSQLQERLCRIAKQAYQSDVAFLDSGINVSKSVLRIKADTLDQQLNETLAALLSKKVASYEKLTSILEHSSFFIFKVKTITRLYPSGWFVDLAALILFFLPVYWKYGERKLNRYYAQRRRIEKQMVVDEYQTFKLNYSRALKRLTGLDIHFYETYEDPPFNTRKKSNSLQLKPQEDLLKKLYALD